MDVPGLAFTSYMFAIPTSYQPEIVERDTWPSGDLYRSLWQMGQIWMKNFLLFQNMESKMGVLNWKNKSWPTNDLQGQMGDKSVSSND